ncbi:DUF998 domain-containing protein [Leifsonia sp. NPDC058194]|uniref:DUF998 domain-containing protein n=1 Tax=Leifsonia sp. NPDC058194 TaxID=3346374 RepID=UPI0036DC67FD
MRATETHHTATAADEVAAERLTRLRSSSVESIALGVGTLAFIAVGVVALIVFGGRHLAISGAGSIGEFAAVAGGIVALLVYAGGRAAAWRIPWFGSAPVGPRSRLNVAVEVFDTVAIAVAHAIVVLLLWAVLGFVLARSFQDAFVFAFPGALLVATAAAVSAYYVFLSAVKMNPLLLSTVLAVFLVLGALTSMITASDPHWWKENLSALGMTDDISGMAFNLTVIVAGVLVTAIARYATGSPGADDRAPTRGEVRVRTALIVIGVMLTCVGLFPVNQFLLIHNTVATGMALVFCALVIGLRWLLPEMPRAFILLGWAFLVVIAVVAVLFAIGDYNLTAVELVAAVLIFSWIIVFLRITTATSADAAAQGQPQSTPAAGGSDTTANGETEESLVSAPLAEGRRSRPIR